MGTGLFIEMTYTTFKDLVAAELDRTAAALVSTGNVDLILTAMNDVRRVAQRDYTFNLAQRMAFVQLSMAPASLLTSFAADPTGAGATVVVKRVDKVFEYTSATVSGTTRYYPTATYPFYPRREWDRNVPLTGDAITSTVQIPYRTLGTSPNFAYIQGQNILHSTLTTPTWYMCDVVEFLGDHAGGSVEDVFLTYFADWLKFATIAQLRATYLRDNSQIAVDVGLVQRLWESVKQYDAQQGAATDSNNLD